MIYIKVIVLLLSLFFSGMFLDELIENIILFSKGHKFNLFNIGLYMITIVLWTGFYYLTQI